MDQNKIVKKEYQLEVKDVWFWQIVFMNGNRTEEINYLIEL